MKIDYILSDQASFHNFGFEKKETLQQNIIICISAIVKVCLNRRSALALALPSP